MPKVCESRPVRFLAEVFHASEWVVAWAELCDHRGSIQAFLYDTRKWAYFDAKAWRPVTARTTQDYSQSPSPPPAGVSSPPESA